MSSAPYISDCDCFLSPLLAQGVPIESADELFGAGSRLWSEATPRLPEALEQFSWVINYGYEALVVIIFSLFCYLLYNSRNSISVVFKLCIGKTSLEKTYNDHTLFFSQYLNQSQLLCLLVAAGMMVKMGDYWGVDRLVTLPHAWMMNLIAPIFAIMLILFYLYKRLVLIIVQAVTLSHDFFAENHFRTQLYLAISCLLFTPLFLLFALSDTQTADILLSIICALAGVLYAHYLLKSCRFFVAHNVSILQWFLYLCAVEFFPISLLLFLSTRNG